VAAAIVADCHPDGLGHGVNAAKKLFDALRLQVRLVLERRIQVGYVRVVMLSMVNLHGLRVDVRLEGGCIVWQGRQGELGHICTHSLHGALGRAGQNWLLGKPMFRQMFGRSKRPTAVREYEFTLRSISQCGRQRNIKLLVLIDGVTLLLTEVIFKSDQRSLHLIDEEVDGLAAPG
jgi:hypothetical protein